jgi:ketosteroid isomerase-like protein
MAQENVQLVRALFDRIWARRDVDAAVELVHPDAVFDWSDSRGPYRGYYKGHAALRETADAIWDAWDEWDPLFEEAIEIDPETVLIVTLIRARGKGSGVPVEAHGASLWSVRDGKIVHAKLFQSKAEALESIGLSSAGSP